MTYKLIALTVMAALAATAAQAKSLRPISSKQKQTAVSSYSPEPRVIYNSNGSTIFQEVNDGIAKGVQTVVSRYGENHRVQVSRHAPNIIMTPFAKPRVVGTQEGYELGSNGSNLIVESVGKKASWISITDKDNPTGVPISLTLVPKNVHSQTIVVTLAGKSLADRHVALGESSTGNVFVDNVNNTFKEIIKGNLPSGYAVRPLKETFRMAADGLKVEPVEMYSSYDNDVYRYRVTNNGYSVQTLSEEQFGRSSRVMGVTIFPRLQLRTGESTEVLIMVGRR